ncbi:helix-turn-helix domain-containing protein [Novosphingobium sp. FKTRR1]|uniref:helix-turn-helix domain-containing protein n=1 Tax=Novosphingobium sp. FKTRR1 TaxID=2879118 RepID=UPI00351CF9BC
MPKIKSSRAAKVPAALSPVNDIPMRKVAPVKPTLGVVVRSLRQANKWTLKEMSEKTGIPFSTLSKVENDRLTLTYDKLLQLAERLNMRMSDLFAEPQPHESAPSGLARRSVGSAETAMRVETPNYDYSYLCTELRKKRMIPVLTRIRAHSVSEFGQLVRHSGEEWAYVLEGQIVVHTEFYDPVTLDVGQIIYLDSGMGHAYVVGEGYEDALMIGSCSSAQEDHLDELLTAHS